MSATNGTLSNTDTNAIVAKICSMFILAVAGTVAGLLPLKLGSIFYKTASSQKMITFEKIMSFSLYFGGGVLMCTVFLHLIPELREKMEIIIRTDNLLPKIQLSYTELIVCFGFFFVYSIEQMAHEAHHSRVHNDDTIELYNQNTRVVNSNGTDGISGATTSPCKLLEKSVKYKIIHCEVQTNGCSEHKHIRDGFGDHKNYNACEKHHHCVTVEPTPTTEPQLLQHYFDSEHIPDFSSSIGSAFLTVMALSVHEIFEGMAVGLENEASMVWYLLAAISCHKIMLSVFVGLQLLATKSKLNIAYIFIAIYAFTSPLGILVGLLVSLWSSKNVYLTLTSIGLQGIATGTLLYVVFFEIYFKNENKYKLNGSLKAVSSISGFVFMAFLQTVLLDKDH